MTGGSIDLFTSRRVDFDLCTYWSRDNDESDLSEYAHENAPTGTFYAKDENPNTLQKQDIGGMFLFDENTITLSTSDAVDIKAGDVICYDDDYWAVRNVQEVWVNKSQQFMKNPSKRTYIQLKR